MFMSVIERTTSFDVFPELAGARVLITGVTATSGLDVAQAFADHGARLVIVSADPSPAVVEIAAVLSESAAELRLFTDGDYTSETVVRLVQRVAGETGGFDVVINLARIEQADLALVEGGADPEAVVAQKLATATLVTQVAANRMRLVWSSGLVLNVVTADRAAGGRARLLSDVVRGMVGQLTRGLAEEWAAEGIRVNAIVPQSSVAALLGPVAEASEAEIASMALRLASNGSRGLSGHLIDAMAPCC